MSKIALLVGTNRPDSNTFRVCKQLGAIYAKLNNPVKLLNLGDLPQELFSPAAYAAKPASFTPFNDAVLESDGLVVVTPEYNGGAPGVLKYFIDMLKFPEAFEKRPVCFVGLAAGRWGALRSVEQMQQIFAYRNAHLFPERVFLPEIHKLLDSQGNITDSEVFTRLEEQAKGFLEFVSRLKA